MNFSPISLNTGRRSASGIEQGLAAPTVEACGELPAQIGPILKAVVQPETAIGRRRVGGVTGDEDAVRPIVLRHRQPQIPEADMVERAGELEAGDPVEQGGKVEIVPGGVVGHGCVEEPAFVRVDAAEELPVAVQVRMQDPVSRLHREPLEALAQLA